jgi:hypothetical protein
LWKTCDELVITCDYSSLILFGLYEHAHEMISCLSTCAFLLNPAVQMMKTRQKFVPLVCLFWFHDFFKAAFSISLSGDCSPLIFKIRQTVAPILMTSQFHDFLKINFWRDFAIWPIVRCSGRLLESSLTTTESCCREKTWFTYLWGVYYSVGWYVAISCISLLNLNVFL